MFESKTRLVPTGVSKSYLATTKSPQLEDDLFEYIYIVICFVQICPYQHFIL